MKNIRKSIAAIAAVAAVIPALCSCSDKNGQSSSGQESVSENSYAQAANESVPDELTQPDPLAPDKNNVQSSTQDDTAVEDTTAAEETSELPSDEGEIVIENSGAVRLKVTDSTSDEKLLKAAQFMFEAACETDWKFHVGCPYKLDYQNYIENDLGWQYYLITDGNISSFADVENEYFKVFSSDAGSDLNELFTEKDGKVYALDGARGSNIFYVSSRVSAMTERKDDKIVFEVNNYYSGNDYGENAHTETDVFSVSVAENGSWRVVDFTLPY
ncbi:MAG: hypothetical protein PUA81_05110 [Oscillospiraceae bacterium]|nr:hypothetical protein [Oscillospiraceae bacterium]